MNVTAVYIDLEQYSHPTATRARYQLASNYLSLFISDWLQERELNLGRFDRFVFVEGSRIDMRVVGDRAFAVNISETAKAPGSPLAQEGQNSTAETHSYFVGKYLEGFDRIDKHFNLSLAAPLAETLKMRFSQHLAYERPVHGQAVKKSRLRLFHRYTKDQYQLVARENDEQEGRAPSEFILMELMPDPFQVHYHVSRVTVKGRRISIANATESKMIVRDV
ncbi:hypothetical protein MWN52_15200 [Pseudoxanthomonas winnipegensis]|uniref:hypothetical protein n=1 Tax=Pseudoxanthomonas winnipegensis TaxID=2480810 RepID=UPI002578BD57|nr:hypothetical protein [Pseudoxanthomonas winnipegensis]WJI14956.1 hypothetical protein MWN52_15200 [Pseudoxanthomonas winnipegensis]